MSVQDCYRTCVSYAICPESSCSSVPWRRGRSNSLHRYRTVRHCSVLLCSTLLCSTTLLFGSALPYPVVSSPTLLFTAALPCLVLPFSVAFVPCVCIFFFTLSESSHTHTTHTHTHTHTHTQPCNLTHARTVTGIVQA